MENQDVDTGQKFVEITMTVVIEYNANEVDVEDVISSAVICFYSEDTYGIELFEPETETMTVHEYESTDFKDVTDEWKDL